MVLFLGDISAGDVAAFKEARKKKRKRDLSGIRDLVLAGAVGERTIRSGLPRALGVRLESHSTSRKNAREILRNGGFLDPNQSGKTSMAAMDVFANDPSIGAANQDEFKSRKKASQGKVFVTGVHPDIPSGVIMRNGVPVAINNPVLNVLERQGRRQAYRAQSGLDYSKIKNLQDLQVARAKMTQKMGSIPGYDLMKGRTLYIGGSDNFYRQNFIPDVDDTKAMMTDKKVKVYGSRLGATASAIKREGLLNLIKQNKLRVATGLGILGVGGTIAGVAAESGIKKLSGNNNSKQVKVKGFYRAGRLVKGYLRKLKEGRND